MASLVEVIEINFLNNPAKFNDIFKLEVVFEVEKDLDGELEWELVYVSSPNDSSSDQLLDTAVSGPVKAGRHKFFFDADAPDAQKIANADIVGVTVISLQCKYKDQLYCKIGYFVTNEYTDEELLLEPPVEPVIEKLVRSVIINDVRVKKLLIKWSDTDSNEDVDMEEEDVEDKENDDEVAPMNGDDENSCITEQVAALNVSGAHADEAS